MTIAYIIEKMSGKGGMERILTDKMNYLAEHTAYEVVVMLLWHDEKPFAYPLSEKVRVVHLNAPCYNPVIGFSVVMWRFRKQIRRINPDITIYTWVAGAFLACYSGWTNTNLHTCIFENHHTLSDMNHNALVSHASKKVDCVVALTDNDAKAFRDAKRVEVIPNFTTISGATTDCSSKHCLAIGRFVDVKDFPRMIFLWKEIVKNHPDWILDIVGEGPEESTIKQMIIDYSLQNSVILHPVTNDVAKLYAQSSIYLLTSKYEGLPMVLLEAQACGLPMIAFDCPYGPREIIEDGNNGYLIPYNDDMTFVNKVSALMSDEALRKNMREAALTASLRYQVKPIMGKWLNLFDSLLS